MTQAVEAILFDLSEVVLRGLKGTNELLGVRLNRAIAEDAFLGSDATRLFHGEILEDEYLGSLIATHDWGIAADDLKGLIRSNFGPVEGTASVIADLKGQGYRLGLLSVHAREWVDFCEKRFRHHEAFDVAVYSFEQGIGKPEPAAYAHALDALESTPEQTIFIDDSPVNVQAARELGLSAIAFEGADSLRGQLIEMGILPHTATAAVK
jgi:FMN phosphatase YigB (HAD superfamily)